MIASYAREYDVPVWKSEEIIDGKLVHRWWSVRLWTGVIKAFKTREEAIAAYWN